MSAICILDDNKRIFYLTEPPYMPTCNTLPLHSDYGTDAFQSNSNAMSKPFLDKGVAH